VCALVVSAYRYRSALTQALHMVAGGAPPLHYRHTSHACRQAAANATVAPVKHLDCTIFFAVRSSLYHLASCTLFEKNRLHNATVWGLDSQKMIIRQNNGKFRRTKKG